MQLVRATILACILSGPSLIVFVTLYYILDNALYAGIAGGVVHFIALGFAFKAYGRLFGNKRT